MATQEARNVIVTDDRITNANLLDLVDGGETTLHTHAGGVGAFTSRCDVYRTTTDQTLNNSTYTRIQYNTERYDNLNEFDSTTNYRFTASATGYYIVSASFRLGTGADGKVCEIVLLKNNDGGTTIGTYDYGAVCSFHMSATTAKVVTVTKLFYLAANDYVEAFAWQNTGSSNLIKANAKGDTTWMTVVRIQ